MVDAGVRARANIAGVDAVEPGSTRINKYRTLNTQKYRMVSGYIGAYK